MPSSNLLAFDELNIELCSDDFDAIELALEYSPNRSQRHEGLEPIPTKDLPCQRLIMNTYGGRRLAPVASTDVGIHMKYRCPVLVG